jgi:hypothetical protein
LYIAPQHESIFWPLYWGIPDKCSLLHITLLGTSLSIIHTHIVIWLTNSEFIKWHTYISSNIQDNKNKIH